MPKPVALAKLINGTTMYFNETQWGWEVSIEYATIYNQREDALHLSMMFETSYLLEV